ncbi:hypothetical protein [Cellulomonas soli]|uniref:Lipoprotein n=1 Tax=Cellulomonas soli TaxID=931535 RepID=A0A512PEK4_9CELL|nr:hypothetical protein [Cellulomonas soli]NYI58889.1 hypothetical protein [Cellulomonas soli]GEP69618.1 hypothetical protein CSO01_23330 [Cellulomonas soli]
MTRRASLVAAVLLVAVATLAAGCSSESPQPENTAQVSDSSLIAGAYANPLDPIMFPDATQQSLITASLEEVVSECMAQAGFTYQAGDAFPQRRGAADAQYTYSVTDPEAAAQYGFHPASWVQNQPAAGAAAATRAEGYDPALFGEADTEVADKDGTVIATYDPDSCSGKAKDSVTPQWAQQDRIVNVAADILLAVSDEVAENPEVKAANQKWSTCMAQAGFDYATPMDANNDERFATDLPTAAEIPVAVASATCQHESGLLRTWSKTRAELTQTELDKYPGIVTEWLQLQDDAATRATS